MARLDSNLAAIKVVKALQAEARAATPAEQEILARWSGWGAVAAVFAEKPGEDRAFGPARQQLRTLLTDKEYAAARRNTINAHYTGTALAQAMWDGLAAFGFTGGRVLEPGCGAGTFIGLAPLGTAMAGIELDPVTAHAAAALYPHAQIRNESFADTQLPEGSFDAAIGNVPFGKIHLNDPRHNPGRRHPIHTHFILKSAALVRPGGWIALITSRYTLDGTGEDAVAARRQLAGLGELAAAVRLPAPAHRRTAGTDVVTDVLVIRRFEDGEHPPPGEPAWMQTALVDVDGLQIPVNQYFADHPGMVLGKLAAGGARRADDLTVIAPAGTDVAGGLATSLTAAAAGRAAPPPRPAVAAPPARRQPEGFQQARPDGTFTRLVDGIAEPFSPPGGPAGQAELRALLGVRDVALALLDAELATTEDTGLVDDLRAGLNARYDAYVAAYGPANRHARQVRIRGTAAGRALREQLLADGHAHYTGGTPEISDPAVRDQLVAAGHATATATGELRFRRNRAARAELQRLLDSGQARAQGGTLTLTEAGRARVLENAADLQDAVTIIRMRPSQGGFRNDPFAVRVLALEKYDPETGTARKNDIMRHRVLLPRPAVEHADDPRDALAICMDRHAEVRLDVIAGLLGAASEQEARDRLGTLVFHDPAEGRLVPAPEYLSGDIRAKLRQAEAAASADPACQVNVQALTEVVPPDLGPADIEARLGAVFITTGEVEQFLREILADEAVNATLGVDAKWRVTGGDRYGVAARITWGTKDRDALYLAEHLLNRRGPVVVTREDAEGRKWTDEEATQAAQGKQAELSDRFAGWAWEDLDRAREICRRYNDAFNSIVLRSYDEVQLSLPGVNRDISPFWWQKAAIARMIYEPTAGLFHDMGAGKTLEQIIGVIEQRRLGLIRKPVICVKNHLLDQFRDEFLWAYPQARILCADTEDLAGEGRRQFIARCAAENPDAIIMTRGAFESIPLTAEGHEAYLDYMKQMFAVHADAVTESVKDEETLLAEFEERLRAYFDPDYQKDEDEPGRKRHKRKVEQDPALCWEQMGIDYVCVDESQDYNNLWVPSDEPGMAIGFTHRSIDLEMKLHAIRGRYGSRACTLATGTPVTNKIPQFYVLQRYLRPERLKAAGFSGYAPWAATFTEAEQRLEMKADGQFRLVPRMRLINFPELLLDLHYFGDFKDADDIGLPRPALRGGKPEIRGVPAVTELLDYQSTLPERYNAARGGGKKHKGDDTVVAVIGDGFRAAQDLRLVKGNHGARPRFTDEPQKIDHIADDIYAEWLAHRDDVYPGEDGQPDPVKGSLQFVFCNEGVPSADWNLYEELRRLLAERGVPRSGIRFIHDAADARKKAALFAACRAGHVAVLIGSTEKMGVGTNAQRRAIGVHHVHPHWRPDYDAQEDARARRPGNLNTEVFIKKWITEGSFDTIRAQACERKSVFLRVVKHRDPAIRSIEAPDDDTVGYAAVAAVGAGEPRLVQKAQLESELQQLARAQRRHSNNQNALKVAGQQALAAITAAEKAIRDIDAAAARVIPTSGDAFRMTVDGTAFTSRREAGEHLVAHLRGARARIPAGACETRTAGMIGGFQLAADLAHDGREDSIVLRLADLPGGVLRLDHRMLPSGIGLVTRLENRLSGLDKLRLEQQAVIDHQRQEVTRAQSAVGAPFPQQDALVAAKNALDALVTELRGDKDYKDADPATTASGLASRRQDHADGIYQPASPGDDSLSQRAPATASPQPANAGTRRAAPGNPAVPGAQPEAGGPGRPGTGAGTGTGTGTGEARPYERARPQDRAHFAREEARGRAEETGIEHYIYADGTSFVCTEARPSRPAYLAVDPGGAWAIHADGQRRQLGEPPTGEQMRAIAGERADPPAVTDWTSAHPLASHIDKLLQDASADSLIVASASANDPQNFGIVFSDWLERRVAEMAGDGNAPGAMEMVKAYFDDPGFGADLTATLAASIYRAHGLGTPPGDLAALAPGVVDIAARHWRELAEETRREEHGCDPASGTCPACAADPHGEEQLRLAAEIDVHMTRLGVPREGRAVVWDSQAGSYIVQRTARQQPEWQLMMPADGAAYAVFRSGQWSEPQLHLRRGEATPAQVARAYAGMLTSQAGTQIRPGIAAAGAVLQQGAVPGGQGTAGEPSPAGTAGPAARQDPQDPQDGPPLAAPGSHGGATDTAPAAAAEPVPDPPGGLVIEHHQQGTLVHGTEKDDLKLCRLLHEHGFRRSDNLDAWYLPRPWTFSTRDRRVTGLTASLQRAGRSFTRRDQPPAPAADDSAPEPVPAGEPYTDLGQAQADHRSAIFDYWQLTRTPAGNNVMATRPPGARPDAVALDETYRGVHASWDQAFAGEPQQVADRFAAWMQAACVLSRNLAAERHRSPKFRQTLGEFIGSATRLASRAQATAQDPAAWARVFAAVPGDNPLEAGAPAAAATPDQAQPAAGTPQAGAASVAVAGSRTGPPPDAPGADLGLSRLPPGTRVRARPGRSEHEEVITLISGPDSLYPDLPATYVGETAGGQRCTVDPAGITEILGTTHPAAHGEMLRVAETGRETGQDRAVPPGAPQDPGSGSTDNPAVAPGISAPADPADGPAAAIWQAPREAARLAAAEGCNYHVYRAADGEGITRCVITAVPLRTATGYLSVTPAGTWTETWRGQDRPLGPGAVTGPDYPVTLSEARALAAAARLEVHITRAAGRAYVSLAEPGAASAPALSFEYGSREVFAGRHITTASRAIAWLGTYRAAADEWAAAHGGDIFTAVEASPGWTCRIAHLIPHLPAGLDHERAVAEHLTAAIRLARRSQPAEAEQALRCAEAASPALVLAPAREAALTEKIESDAARYAWTGTPGRYIAEVMQATPPEWEWIDRRIAAGIYAQDPASARQPGPPAATAQDNTAAARDLAGQARAAYDQGRHGQALALVDDAEICDPVQQHRYDQIRQVITTAAAAPPATPAPDDRPSGPAQAQPEPGESQVRASAAQSLPGQPVPDLSELPPEPAAPPREPVGSWSPKSMKDYMAAQDALAAWRLADEAGRLQRAGASHQDLMMALAGAESVAPEAGRPFHAARLDAYAAAYGLRGWYRGTGRDRDGRDGQPVVHVNRIRTAADGDCGRYFYHGHSAISGPDYVVIDRDTGQSAAHCATREEADAWIEHAEERAGPVTGADAAQAIPPSAAGDEAAATKGKETGAVTTPAAPAAPATPPMTGPAGPPDGTQPVTAHTEWGGPLRPERLLYADGTSLTVRGQGEDGGQVLQATAAGAAPAPAGSDHAPGRLQVVQWETGGYGIVHPALACRRGIDPYSGLSDRDRARWEAFDLAEAWPTNVAGLPPHLVDPGDILQVERGPRSRVMDLYEVRSIQPGTGRYAGGLEFKVKGRRSPLHYPDRSTIVVGIPAQHPSLTAVIPAAGTAGPGEEETAAPAAGDTPAVQPAADDSDAATRAMAPDQDRPGAADGVQPVGQGQYSSRICISDEPGRPTVSGTSYADDPPELREALRDNGFQWRKQRKVWEYTGRDAGRQKPVTAIRELLTRLDRDAVPGGEKTFPPTPQQQAILDACAQGKNVAVQALAGTGKTTTLVLVARALMDRSPGTRIVYTAFNADIVADARRGRFGRNVTAMTMHSIAKQALLGTSYASKITDGGKGARWPEQWADVLGIPGLIATGSDPVPAEAVARLVIATVRKFRESADEQPERQHLPGHLAGAPQSPLARAVLSYARKAWADITDTGNTALLAAGRALRVDHDDYLKVWALCRPRIGADVIFFDEAQDVNAVMRQVILDQPAQTVVVGDSHQSIYGFRGAIDALKDWPADVVLPLTRSWRFGPDAAGFGNLFLRSLGSGLLLEGNPALSTRLGRADDPDAILCRTNATAVAEVFAGLESGRRTALAGGGQAINDIAKAARDLQAGRGTRHPDLSRFADWDEVRAYAQEEEDGKSLQVLVRLVDRHGPNGLIDMISRLTLEEDTKNPPQLSISTVHKAKGREWGIVRIAGDFRGPVTDPETGDTTWPSPEERRLAYVAATRAKDLLETGSLTWIHDYPQTGRRDGQGMQRTPPLQELGASTDPRPAAPAQPSPAPDSSTTATAGQPAPGPGQEAPGHAAAGGSPHKPGQGTRDDAPAPDDAQADRIVAAARRRAEARDQAHVPIDYARANAMVRRQPAALTRAVNSGDPAKVILAAQKAVSEWNQPAMAWPDDWSRWQRALDHVLPWNQRILLDDLPAADNGTPRPGDTAERDADATAETVPGPAQGKPAASGDPDPTAAPVNNSDLAAALHRLPGGEFARFVSGAGTPGPAGSGISRRDGEPDAGAHEELEWDASGIDITIRARGTLRHSLVSWAQVASWIDPGMTPARLGLIIETNLLSNFCRSRREELIAAGNTDPDAAGRELSQIRDDTINAVISTALSTRGAAAPVPPARPARPGYQTAAMITRPVPAASKDENAALERLAHLRAVIRQLQPASDADIKTTITRWIGDGLPDYVRALGRPAAMREWITGQVTTRAGRPGHGTYDTPGISGGLWSGASPEGLLTARDGEHRTETLTPWAEIPAWIQPGISSQCREWLLAADGSHRAIIRRQLSTAAHTLAAPGDQQDREKEQAARTLRVALDAAWAAIDAAPVPTPGQREQTCRTYQEDTSPAQERLFGDEAPADRPRQEARKPAGDPAGPGQPPPVPAETGPARQPAGKPTAPRTSSTPSAPARQQDAPAPGASPRQAPAVPGDKAQSAALPGTSSNSLTSDDIFLGLRRLPVLGFADLICAMGDGQPLDSLARHLEPRSGERAADEPDTGARETVTCTPRGVRIQVAAGSGTRAGMLAWPEVADWLRPGLSPGSLQIMRQAAQTRLRLVIVNASFRAVGEADMAASAELELRDLIGAAVGAALEAARSAAGGKPIPGGRQFPPAYDGAAALERIGHLSSALPAWPLQPQKPVSQVQAGDIIGHPWYKLQPFRVSAPPRRLDGVIEITGRLTRPGEGEPAREITWTMTTNGQADPPVRVVPVPARSLRPGPAERTEPAAGQEGLTQDSSGGPGGDDPQRQGTAAPDPGPPRDARRVHGGAAGAPAAGNAPAGTPTPASGDGIGSSQPHGIASATEEEDTMPPVPAAEPVPATETSVAAGPGPAQAGPSAAREAAAETRTAGAPADRADGEARLLQQLDDVLTAIFEHRRATAQATASAIAGFADIRAAFASLRSALELPADSSQPRPGNTVPGPAAGQPPPATATARHDRLAPEADDFGDIRAAFTVLRQALDLPARGRHTRAPGPNPVPPEADAASDRLLDQAAAEAQACARWYRDTPEWQRITTVSRAAQDLITTIGQASGEYWAEIRQDIRVRGFVRTVAARTSLAVSGAAHILAGRLEQAGNKDTRIWRAAWELHRATATFADRVMRYTPPRNPDRMDEVRHIINDLGQRQRRSGEPGSSRATGSRSREAGTTSAVALGMEGFPLPVSPTTIRQAAAPAARAAAPPSRHAQSAARP